VPDVVGHSIDSGDMGWAWGRPLPVLLLALEFGIRRVLETAQTAGAWSAQGCSTGVDPSRCGWRAIPQSR
jgi:hypothetical protein